VPAVRHPAQAGAQRRFPSLHGAWECEGLPRAIAIDNGPEFANRHLDDAARQVDFDVLPCPVRVPWFKGIVEGFFSRLNRQLLRSLPGTTFANVVDRGDYDPAQHACLSMAALEEILVLFCVDSYPQRFNRHLGGRPVDLWRNDPVVRDGLLPHPPSAEDLRVLMGWTEQRTVTRRGVQIDHLLYQCDDLRVLRGQTVLVKLDPRDLGQVWVLDPRPGSGNQSNGNVRQLAECLQGRWMRSCSQEGRVDRYATLLGPRPRRPHAVRGQVVARVAARPWPARECSTAPRCA
jgi:putative transposase